MAEPLLVAGAEAEDIATISALVQDGVLKASDMGFDRQQHRFVLLFNRYRWEKRDKTRTRAALRIDSVMRVQKRNWPKLPSTTMELLALRYEDQALHLDFAGGAALKLDVEAIDILLEDLSGPWGAKREPNHAL